VPVVSRVFALFGAVLAAGFFACENEHRSGSAPTPWVGPVAELLDAKCVRCHAGLAPAGGWRADSWLGVVGCTASGAPATASRDGGRPPLLAALDRPDHAGLVNAEQRALLEAFVASGSTRSGDGVHGRSFADPRSPASHGRLLRSRRWAPMLDPNDADACATCHDGAGPRRPGITRPAANAPACTTCHVQPDGPIACNTCHGHRIDDPSRTYPPRDRCFFPDDPEDRAHAAHAGTSASRSTGLPCSTCHPVPASGPAKITGVHGNGWADVWFDYAVAGREARFDPATKSCSGTCHARGGTRPAPTWNDPPMTCNDCHSSPPPRHYAGSCTPCHHEANADGTALVSPVLHADGKVDLGDGSGGCGACHGRGDDPWPKTGAHAAHAQPTSSKPAACESCHSVPAPGERHPVGKGAATVRLAGLAAKGGRRPSWDATTKTCADTYCHDHRGGGSPAPSWTDGPRTCSSCHSSPPPPPHPQSSTCGGATCHEGRTSGLSMTPAGRVTHVDGLIDRAVQ
jgi:predicted CxxxxCH...CXXCH cytochrome family protein